MAIGLLTKIHPSTGLRGRVRRTAGALIGAVRATAACIARCCVGGPVEYVRANACVYTSPCVGGVGATLPPIWLRTDTMADDGDTLLGGKSLTFLYDAGNGAWCYTAEESPSEPDVGAHKIPEGTVVQRQDDCADPDCPDAGFYVQATSCSSGAPVEVYTCLEFIDDPCSTYRSSLYDECVEFRRSGPFVLSTAIGSPHEIADPEAIHAQSCCQCGVPAGDCMGGEGGDPARVCCCGRIGYTTAESHPSQPIGTAYSRDCEVEFLAISYIVESLLGGGTSRTYLRSPVTGAVGLFIPAWFVQIDSYPGEPDVVTEFPGTIQVYCTGEVSFSIGNPDLASCGLPYTRRCARDGNTYSATCSPGSPPSSRFTYSWAFTTTCTLQRPCLKCNGDSTEDGVGSEDSGGEPPPTCESC